MQYFVKYDTVCSVLRAFFLEKIPGFHCPPHFRDNSNQPFCSVSQFTFGIFRPSNKVSVTHRTVTNITSNGSTSGHESHVSSEHSGQLQINAIKFIKAYKWLSVLYQMLLGGVDL